MEEQHEAARYEHRGDNLSRLVGLTDGICGTALTLLALNLDIPELVDAASDPALWQAVVDMYPKLLSYFLTFWVVGAYWVAHHWEFERIVRYDRHLLSFNLMFLSCIGLLPFTTGLLGEHHSSQLVWTIYALNMILTGLTLTGLWGHAVNHGMVDARVITPLARYITLRSLVVPGVFVFSIGVAFLSPSVASYSPLLIITAQVVLRRVYFGPETRSEVETAAKPFFGPLWLWEILGYASLLAFIAWSLYVWFWT